MTSVISDICAWATCTLDGSAESRTRARAIAARLRRDPDAPTYSLRAQLGLSDFEEEVVWLLAAVASDPELEQLHTLRHGLTIDALVRILARR